MWGSAAPNILHHLPERNELLFGLPLVDRPYVQPVSFSLWKSAESATTFAYRDEGHRDAVARVRRSQKNLLDSYSTASFEPYRCDGAWKGNNPLAAALSPDDSTISGLQRRCQCGTASSPTTRKTAMAQSGRVATTKTDRSARRNIATIANTPPAMTAMRPARAETPRSDTGPTSA